MNWNSCLPARRSSPRVGSILTPRLCSFLGGFSSQRCTTCPYGSGSGTEILGRGLVPDTTQMPDADVHNYLAAVLPPAHARTFESLREYGFAGSLGHAAADG